MRICRTALTLIARHRVMFLLYVVVLSVSGYLMGGSIGGQTGYTEARPTVAVIDRDDSEVSRALAAAVRAAGDSVEVEDSVPALQDAAARDIASYVLVIPEGYGTGLIEAARVGIDAPDLECVVSYSGASGALMDRRVRAWAQRLYALAASSEAPAAELVALTKDAGTEGVAVEAVRAEATGLPTSYLVYCQFATYPLFGGIAAIVATGLASLRDEDARRRVAASRVSEVSMARQLACAIVFAGVGVWAVSSAVGLVLCRDALAGVPAAYIALALLLLLALSFVGSAFGFVLWQVGARAEVAHAAANIGSMVFTFLAGTWVPIDQMGEGVRALGSMTPGFWAVSGLGDLARAVDLTPGVVGAVLSKAGLVVLFAVAIALVALVLGRIRRRALAAV